MSLNHNDPCVQKHIDLLQTAINRMASNSSSCKTWCTTIISGIIVVSIDKNQPAAVLVALMPTVAFTLLDGYYLSLEREIRKIYKNFIAKLHGTTATETDLYNIDINVKWYQKPWNLFKALSSFSVWPLYSLLSMMLLAVHLFLTKTTVCKALNTVFSCIFAWR